MECTKIKRLNLFSRISWQVTIFVSIIFPDEKLSEEERDEESSASSSSSEEDSSDESSSSSSSEDEDEEIDVGTERFVVVHCYKAY